MAQVLFARRFSRRVFFRGTSSERCLCAASFSQLYYQFYDLFTDRGDESFSRGILGKVIQTNISDMRRIKPRKSRNLTIRYLKRHRHSLPTVSGLSPDSLALNRLVPIEDFGIHAVRADDR